MLSVRVGAVRVAAWIAAAAAAILAVPVAPAQAHAELLSSTPKDGASVQALPAEVALEFSEEVGTSAFLEVSASDGTVVGDGEPEVLGATVTQSVSGDGPSGTYTIAYRVVSADGHPISDELTFDVTAGQPPDQGDSSHHDTESDESDEGFFSRHVEHFALAAVGLVAGAWLVRAGLRGRS